MTLLDCGVRWTTLPLLGCVISVLISCLPLPHGCADAANSIKRGLAVSPKPYLCGDLQALHGLTWWYDWKQEPDYYNCSQPMPDGRVPMVWGWRSGDDYPINISDHATTVLGFNEPNMYTQANLSAEEAARAWHKVQGQLGHVRTWISPATFRGPCGDPTLHVCREDAILWYKQFFQACPDCHVDYLAVHVYWCDADAAMTYLQQLWDLFHLKLWVTEFACPDVDTVSGQLTFMQAILPRLESAPFISRYSWYTTRQQAGRWIPQSASLLEQNSSTLTSLGRFYMSF